MKVAFTSSDGKTIDRHFGQASAYWIWEVGPERAELLGPVSPLIAEGAVDEEGRTSARADAVSGCAIVYTQQIGGPAAAKLVARKIHPMKTGGGEVPIAEAIAKLQAVLRGNPPPWLRKAMGGEAVPSFSADE
ncbi:MAG TPA: nitrogen fixation protein NifX [Anaeromyxobacter sp.]